MPRDKVESAADPDTNRDFRQRDPVHMDPLLLFGIAEGYQKNVRSGVPNLTEYAFVIHIEEWRNRRRYASNYLKRRLAGQEVFTGALSHFRFRAQHKDSVTFCSGESC